jgi:hypothetical protein
VINSSDIPSAEVKTYYVKEAWYFDQNNSIYDVKTLAICPIAFLISDFGEQRTPMFWQNMKIFVRMSKIRIS